MTMHERRIIESALLWFASRMADEAEAARQEEDFYRARDLEKYSHEAMAVFHIWREGIENYPVGKWKI